MSFVDKAVDGRLLGRQTVNAAQHGGVIWSNRPTDDFPRVFGENDARGLSRPGPVDTGDVAGVTWWNIPTVDFPEPFTVDEGRAATPAVSLAVGAGRIGLRLAEGALAGGVVWGDRATTDFPKVWGDGEPQVIVAPLKRPAERPKPVEKPRPAETTVVAKATPEEAPIQSPVSSARPRIESGRKPIVAVMEIEDKTGLFKTRATNGATDYFRGQLNGRHLFVVIDKSRQEAELRTMLAEQKRESYRECYDTSCQIPLGQALAADTVIRTTISSLANFCMLSCELIDLRKEAADGGGIERFDCSEPGLGQAIDRMVTEIAGGRRESRGP